MKVDNSRKHEICDIRMKRTVVRTVLSASCTLTAKKVKMHQVTSLLLSPNPQKVSVIKKKGQGISSETGRESDSPKHCERLAKSDRSLQE